MRRNLNVLSSLFRIVAFGLLTLLSQRQAAAGTLWNGGFESGSLAPWITASGTAAIGKTAHSGNYGLTTGPGAAEAVVYQEITGLAPGQAYLVSAWVSASSTTANGVELAVGGTNGLAGAPSTATTSWQQISQSFTAGADGAIWVYLAQLPSSSAATVFWDDVEVVAVPPANGGFESGSLAPWTISQGVASVGTTAYSGSYGLTMGPSAAQTIASQTVSGLIPGETYVVSAWVMASSAANGGVELAVSGANGLAGTPLTPTTTWQQISQPYTVGTDETLTVYLAQLPSSAQATTYWDDVSITSAGGNGVPGPNVVTYHNDQARTGQNLNEVILTPANVTPAAFGKLFTRPVDGWVLAQPLYMTGQFVAGSGFHNVIVAATEADSVYLFDADSNQGGNANALWHVNLTDTAHGGQPGEAPVTTGQCSFGTATEGVTSTPVIDPNAGVLYVEAESSLAGSVVHRLHAIDLTSGAEEPGWPVTIAGSVPGTGDGSVDGQLTFNPNVQLSRPGLLLSGGGVYVSFASVGCDSDYGDVYHGWLFRYDAVTGAGTVISVTPNGHADASGAPAAGGIWMSGAAPAADAAGNVYLATANGTFDTSLNANNMPSLSDFGDSVLRIATGAQLTITDYFTPINQGSLDDADADLGSGGVLLLPDQIGPNPHLLVTAGKDKTIRLINRDQMNKYCGTCTADPVVQELQNALPRLELGMPAYWNGLVYFGSARDYIRAYSLTAGQLSTSPVATSTDPPPSYYGTTPSISASGTTNGILWGIQSWSGAPDSSAALKAWDATSLSELYSSNNQFGTDPPGGYVEFAAPTVAHGKVYVGTQNTIGVFGLLSSPRSTVIANGAFQSGSLSPGWNTYIPSGGTGSITVTSAAALSGSYGLQEGANSNGEVVYQTVQGLTPGQSYMVAAWVKLGSGTAGTVYLYADDTTGANSCVSPAIPPTATSWQQISCLYTVTSNQAMNVHLVENAGSFTSYWNNVTVTLVPPVNGGFETGIFGQPWSGYIPAGGTGSFAVSPVAAHSGSYGLVEGPNSSAEVAYQTVQGLAPGQSYIASAWVMLGSGTPGTAYLYADDSTGANTCTSPSIVPTAVWQQLSCAYTATNNQEMAIHLVESAGPFSTYWDDVALTPVPPVNGGFENGSFSQPWSSYIPTGGSGSLSVSSLAAHSGSYGLVEGPNTIEEAAYQTVFGLIPGQSYAISAWVKLGAGTAGTVFLYANDTQNETNCGTALVTPTSGWQQVACIFTATSNQSAIVYLVENPGSFSTYWDDVAVTPAPPVNGGFETGTFSQPWNTYIPLGGTGSITVSTAAAHSGGWGLVEGPNSSDEVAYQVVNGVIAGQSYVVSAWVKLGGGVAGQAYLYVDDSTGANFCGTALITPGPGWQQISCVYTATSNQAMSIHLVELAGLFTTYWDDVTVTGPLPANIWANFAPAAVWTDFLGYQW